MSNEKLNNRMNLDTEDLYDFVVNASISLHWVDKNGIIIWANQAELDTMGYSADEYIGFPISDFHADPHVISDILTRLTHNETLVNYNARLKCKDGSIKHVLINSNVYRKGDEFIHTRCFTRDISDLVLEAERKSELLRKLEENEEQLKMFRDIIASSYDAIISKDLNGLVTSWNTSAETTFGYTAEEMIGNPISILMPQDRLYEEHEIYERLRRGEHVHHFETKRLTKEQRILDVSLAISPIKDKQGNIIGLSKIVRDITEKKLEETRKNTFVSMVSHELKTPLTSILAYVQILLAKAKKAGDAFNITALTKTEAQAKKMTIMAQNFLDIGRLEEGKIPLNKSKFDINALILEVIEDINLVTTSHQINYTPYDGVAVYADREKIGQVITNLISNAIKYSPQKPIVTVRCEKDQNGVTIAIKDQGIGISESDQAKLFDRFYRVENEVVGMVSGFGIGLYLVAEILRLHDTSIHVESKEGEGSTFTFSLVGHSQIE